MLNRKLGAIALIIILIIAAYLLFDNIKHAHEAPLLRPQEGVLSEKEEPPVIYAIPSNTIPTIEAIREQITQTGARKGVQREAGTKLQNIIPQEAQSFPVTATTPGEAVKKSVIKTLPEKKEVKFPTYEERRKNESAGGIVAY